MAWYERPVRMMRLDYIDRLARMREVDLDALARSKAEEWHINCEWVIGTPGTAPGLGYYVTFDTPKFEKYPALGDFDLIRSYLPHARKYGIHVLAYINAHWFSYDFADANPGWEQLLADGTPYGRVSPLYGCGTTFCVNSGWRDWAQDLMIEVMKTGIDGIFLDGPVVYPGCCYCPSCREKFKARFGAEIPPAEDWADESYKDFIEFREDSMAGFLADCRSSMKSVNPDGVIFLNGGSWHAGAWRVARDIEKVGEFEDFNGAEAFFHPGPRNHPLHFWSLAAKHLVAGGKPAVVFSHHALGSWHYVPLPPIETQLAIAQTVACGANPWIAIFDYALDGSRELALQPVREIQGFLERHEDYYAGSESAADIALLYSRQTSTYYISALEELYGEQGSGQERDLIADIGSGKKIVPTDRDARSRGMDWKKRKQICDELHGNTYLGYFTALAREHIPFDVILDKDLSVEGLSKYRVLILPNTACLSDSQIEAIEAFAEKGGGILAEFETGWYDERGRRRPENPLGRLLGVDSVEGLMPPAAGEEYIKVKAPMPSFNPEQLIARPQFSLIVSPSDRSDMSDTSDATALLFMERIGQLYSALKGETGYPALVTSSKAVYLPALVGEFYARYRMWEYQALIGNAVRSLYGKPLPLQADCPQTVEIELRRQPGRLLIHLVNNTGDMQRPMSEIIPLRDIRISIQSDPIKRVYSLWSRADLAFTQEDGIVGFALPNLGLYEVVVLE
ncbi:MAG TPA: alpha-amylase family protein [Armatimonadota bacterium]|nr:alpha-amylase family protein [Armatimonadota bacterium]